MTVPGTRPLDAADRCDRCSSRALVVVDLAGSTLMFCGHDFNLNEERLAAAGGRVAVDEREFKGPALLPAATAAAEPESAAPVEPAAAAAEVPVEEVLSRPVESVPDGDLHAHPGVRVVSDTLPNGTVRLTRVNSSGRLSDGPMGEPAVETIKQSSGRTILIEHYDDGAKQDSVSGQAGEMWYFEDGSPFCRRHYTRGRLNDTPAGSPAVVYLNHSGAVVRSDRYTDGELQRARRH